MPLNATLYIYIPHIFAWASHFLKPFILGWNSQGSRDPTKCQTQEELPSLVARWWGSWRCAWRCRPDDATGPPAPTPCRTPLFIQSFSNSTFSTQLVPLLLFEISADTCVRSAWTGSISGKQLIPRVMPPGRQNRSLRQSRFFGPSAAQSINVDENASWNCDQCHTYTFKENGR